jgi:hypothetical protein
VGFAAGPRVVGAHSRHRSIATLMLYVVEDDRRRTQTTLADLVAGTLANGSVMTLPWDDAVRGRLRRGEGGATDRTLGLPALERAAHGIHISFDAIGHGPAGHGVGAMHSGEVVSQLFDAFQACGQRDPA